MIKLAIDFGTAVTKIFRLGSGIVLAEATCVSADLATGKIRAFGDDAKRLLGKTAEPYSVVFPVYEGKIRNEEVAGELLAYFVRKVAKRSLFGIEALFCVPTGCSREEREMYLRIAQRAGISRAEFAESPYLAVLGQDVPLSESNPVFAADFGAGKASVSAFSLDGTIAGLTMNVGGNNIDANIIDTVSELYNLQIGSLSAEKLKNTAGSLIEGDNRTAIVEGRDTATGLPRSVSVTSEDILFPVRVYVDKILEYAELLLRKLPAEVSAVVCKSGLFASGGIANLAGFSEYVARRMGMETHLAEDNATAVVLGGGRAVGNPALLNRIRLS